MKPDTTYFKNGVLLQKEVFSGKHIFDFVTDVFCNIFYILWYDTSILW